MVSMQTKNWANISSHPSMSSEKSFTYTIGPDEKENIDSNRGLSVKLEMEERIKTDVNFGVIYIYIYIYIGIIGEGAY